MSKVLFVVLLSGTLGLHWALLQTVAWCGMVVSYSQSAPLREAFSKTFDGKHPCNLCKFVREGHNSEQRQEAQKQIAPLDGLPIPSRTLIFPPVVTPLQFAFVHFVDARSQAPPIPPPRSLPS